MDRIDAMKVFVATLDEGSLAGASRRLGRSPAAVSRAIAFLEAHVGSPLLHRTTRTIKLSEAGERYAAAPELYAALLEEIARRGLLYIDPRPGATAPRRPGMPPFRAIDVIIDVPPFRTDIDARLARLEQVARQRGTAIGLATGPLPTTTERIAVWATALPARGFALVPVSSLAAPPPDKP